MHELNSGSLTTSQLLAALRRANPDRHVTEAVIRWPIRTQQIEPPPRFGSAYAWRASDVRALCDKLKLKLPAEVRDVS